MKTTLKELKELKECGGLFDYDKLTSNLGTENLDTEVTILEILNLNGIKDAVYALRTQKYKDYCLFNADVAESVLHLFEEKYPDEKRARKCTEGIRLYHAGKITQDELEELREDVNNSTVYCASASIYTTTARFAVDYANNTCTTWEEIEVLLRKYL